MTLVPAIVMASSSTPTLWLGWAFQIVVLILFGGAFLLSLVIIVGGLFYLSFLLIRSLLSGTKQEPGFATERRQWPRFSLLGLLSLTACVAFWCAVGGQLRWQFVTGAAMIVGAMTPIAMPLFIMLVANWFFSASDRKRLRAEVKDS